MRFIDHEYPKYSFKERTTLRTSLEIDRQKANDLADVLYGSFATNGTLGNNEMPEDIVPKGV